jgi:cyclopropane fatty-acyl-phospholipid synthase-like methyltransferase
MEITDHYVGLISDTASRTDCYAEMVETYYEMVTQLYRDVWADSFHLTWFDEGKSLGEAQLAEEHWLADQAGFRPGDRLIDVGCGIGGPAAAVAAHTGARVTGVNISRVQVEIARTRPLDQRLRDQLDFVKADVMNLPFDPGQFDGAFSIEALCHTPDKRLAYAHIARVLKPGAPFVGTDWFHADGLSAADYARWIEPICQTMAMPHLLSFGELRRALEDAGFEAGSLSEYREHGAVEPNWKLFDPIEQHLGATDEPQYFKAALDALRDAYGSGAFVLGCWVARKKG